MKLGGGYNSTNKQYNSMNRQYSNLASNPRGVINNNFMSNDIKSKKNSMNAL